MYKKILARIFQKTAFSHVLGHFQGTLERDYEGKNENFLGENYSVKSSYQIECNSIYKKIVRSIFLPAFFRKLIFSLLKCATFLFC